MKIGIDITSLAVGRGPARYTTEIVKALAGCAEKDDVFNLYSPYENIIGGDLPYNFIHKAIPLKKHCSWLNWSLPRQTRKDGIEVMYFPANDFWLWPHARTVVTILDVAPKTVLKGFGGGSSDRIQSFLQSKALVYVSWNIITISNYSAEQIVDHFKLKHQRPTVIYCGVSQIFRPAAHKTGAKDYILFVGGFDRRKNLERLLQSYKMLVNRNVRSRLVLAGSEGKNKKLYYDIDALVKEAALSEHVDVIKDPPEDRLVELYANAKMLVLPSLVEGFGLPVLEAMACGCPVACSGAASLPEVGGDAVQYFDPYNIYEMVDSINKVLSSENVRKEMVAKGLERVKKYRWDEAGRKVYSVIKNIYRSR